MPDFSSHDLYIIAVAVAATYFVFEGLALRRARKQLELLVHQMSDEYPVPPDSMLQTDRSTKGRGESR